MRATNILGDSLRNLRVKGEQPVAEDHLVLHLEVGRLVVDKRVQAVGRKQGAKGVRYTFGLAAGIE